MFISINPATGQSGQSFAELTEAQIDARLTKAHDAFLAWRESSLDERTTLLRHIAERFEDDKDRLARIATEEMGKTLKSAIAEVEKCASAFRYYARHGAQWLKPVEVDTPVGHAVARWLPMGPVLAVMPWNFPYWQVVRFAAPAIMAGNVGLLKHASSVQGCASALEETILAGGAPDGLFQNLAITSGKVADLIADERIVAVTLTGSEGAGA
jgi:succinate-semialdehyde dehydrogenase/glutarate-semialdehyde dehydrogenase